MNYDPRKDEMISHPHKKVAKCNCRFSGSRQNSLPLSSLEAALMLIEGVERACDDGQTFGAGLSTPKSERSPLCTLATSFQNLCRVTASDDRL